jgi:hypothetical protein
MRVTRMTLMLAVSALCLGPIAPHFDQSPFGAAFAKGGDNGGGNGGGNGNSGGNGNGNSSGNGKGTSAADSKPSKSKAASGTAVTKKKVTADPVIEDVAVEEDPAALKPNELGKMNGALHANINAVLAHIRNGQTTNGPVGLLAGLAVADGAVGEAAAKAAALETEAAGYVDLETALADAGVGSVQDYLAARADGTLTEEQVAAIDPLIDAVGGLNADGTDLADTGPTPEEVQAALDAAAAAETNVAAAEQAIADAWNKDGDLETLLVALREKLAPYQEDIAAAAGTNVEEPAVEGEIVN